MIQQVKRATLALLLGLFCMVSFAQKTVSGTVRDIGGEPMVGVTVSLDGKPVTVSDLDGNFTVSNVKSSSVIAFSYVGYLDQEVSAGSKTKLDVVMEGGS